MTICRNYGYPTLFFTFTCNSKWPEIQEALNLTPGQRVEDRLDLVARVFGLKVRTLLEDLMKKDHFGKATAGNNSPTQHSNNIDI